MKSLKVALGSRSYDIIVGNSLLPGLGAALKKLGLGGKAVIITDTSVFPLYAATVEKSLADAGFRVAVIQIPPGESQKTLAAAGALYEKLAAAYTERSTPLIALGGGVVGDLAGFVAATYMRGLPFIQVPTTLLAMVDSSVGGKTAVDHGSLKNTVGAFYQPRLVLADFDTLRTLPDAEISNGMAEAIKMAAIRDARLFAYMEKNLRQAMLLDPVALEVIVGSCVLHKAVIVGHDERDAGRRLLLNHGHTFGHAFEAVSGFTLKHGTAVAMGMAAENRLAVRLGLLAAADAARVNAVIRQAGLPVEAPHFSDEEKEKVLDAMRHDKKVRDDRIRFVLLKAIGRAVIREDVDGGLIREVLFGREPA